MWKAGRPNARTLRVLNTLGWPRSFRGVEDEPHEGVLVRDGEVFAKVWLDQEYGLWPALVAPLVHGNDPTLSFHAGQVWFVESMYPSGAWRTIEQVDRAGRTLFRCQFPPSGDGTELWIYGPGVHISEVTINRNSSPWLTRIGPLWCPFEETYFDEHVQRHGPHRKWTDKGRLSPGYPHRYVHGVRVTVAEYEAARRTDASLRPVTRRENRPERPLPDLSTVWLRADVRRALELRTLFDVYAGEEPAE